jgi:hypothetical protein
MSVTGRTTTAILPHQMAAKTRKMGLLATHINQEHVLQEQLTVYPDFSPVLLTIVHLLKYVMMGLIMTVMV